MEIRCVCPPKADGSARHDHDEITLKEKLDFRSAISIRNELAFESAKRGYELEFPEILAILTERFILYGIEAWTVVDEKNKPVDVDRPAIEALIFSDMELAEQIGDETDERYRAAALAPLIKRGQTSSRGSSTSGSTSARRSKTGRATTKSSTRSSTRRKPSSPSSISTIPTAVTETTSSVLDGDSSLSPKSTTAA